MAKVVDISDKLSFDENPKLKIMHLQVEVKADAESMVKLMGVLAKGNDRAILTEGLNCIFKEEDVKKICKLKYKKKPLSSKSLMTIIEEGMNLVMGEMDEEGELETPTTT